MEGGGGEGEAAGGRGRRAGRPAPPAADDEVQELSDPIPQERPADAIRPESARPAERTRAPDPVPPADLPAAVAPAKAEAEQKPEPATKAPPGRGGGRKEASPTPAPIVSSDTVEATRGALDQLSRLMVKPEPGADGTLEGLVREMLRPMLRDWLDTNLPALVEDMVAREIEKITSSRR